MIKTFSLPKYEQKPLASSVTTESLVCSSSDIDSEEETDTNDSVLVDSSKFAFLPKHHGCFAHVLQLVVKDGMKECGHLGKIISKASAIVAHVNRSAYATELLENFNKLQSANITRWNSK